MVFLIRSSLLHFRETKREFFSSHTSLKMASQTQMSLKKPNHTQPPLPKINQQVKGQPKKASLLPPQRRTHALIWLAAILCIVFSILVILTGIVILIIFLVIKPRHPSFDTTSASLNNIYLDTPNYLNGDLTFLANFSNPNHKIDLGFEFLSIELYFADKLIASRSLEPFRQRRGEARVESVHMISSEVYLPLNLSLELQKQVASNQIRYNIRGIFRVRASLGLTHFSYWLYGRCQIELTGPPSGVLVARSCHTK